MKKQILWITAVLLFMFLSVTSGQYTWQKQESPVNTNLIAVSFTDSLHGWIAANDGTILSTNNGGKDWQTLVKFENTIPSKIFFRNTQLGWLAGKYNTMIDSAFILRTTDGGNHWEPVFQRKFYKLNDLFFIDDTMGWVAGCELSESDTLTLMMHSTDGGFHWTIPFSARIHQTSLYSIHFRDINYGQSCGEDGAFFTTNNGGRNEISGWGMNIAIPSYGKDLYDIFNVGENFGCAVGEGGFILLTKDKWANNLDYNTPSEDTLFAITGLPDGVHYWAVGKNGCIARATYGFSIFNISEEDRITPYDLFDTQAVSDHHVWAVGENGTILFYGKTLTGIQDNLFTNLIKVYPNPARDYISIKFSDTGEKKLQLLTMDGRILYSKLKPEGDYEMILRISGFPDGVYLLKIENEYQKLIIK
jgi:photosystem II stability/assembly factor-like uncharacterized protein